jgi:co-chaperonin GroES (HSP10)
MLEAYTGKVIAEIEKDDFVEMNGLYLPSKQKTREFMKANNIRIIDENYTNHIREGTVTSVGKNTREVHEGDRVVFNRHNGVEFDFDGKRYISIDETWVLAVLT